MGEKINLFHFVLTVEKKSGAPFVLKPVVRRDIRRAVDRNRVKRVVREFFRTNSALLPWGVVVCRIRPSAAKVKNALLFQDLVKLLHHFS